MSMYLKTLNEYYSFMRSETPPRSEDIDRTIMLPKQFLCEFLVDIAKKGDLYSHTGAISLSERLMKSDMGIKEHSISDRQVTLLNKTDNE